MEGLAEDGRERARGVGLCVGGTASTSEHTDWISEMSKSDASLPRRLLARLPALLPARLPGRLGVFLGSGNCVRTLAAAVVIKPLSSPEWKPFPDRYPGSRSLLPWMGVPLGVLVAGTGGVAAWPAWLDTEVDRLGEAPRDEGLDLRPRGRKAAMP